MEKELITMANQRNLIREGQLKVVGRYMDGSKIVGYHVSGANGGGDRVTTEQLYSLIKKGQIQNVTAQLYNGKPLFRGADGFKMSDLPVYDIKKGEYKNTSGDIRGKKDNGSLGKLTAKVRLMVGNTLVAVVCTDGSNTERVVPKRKFEELAFNGNIYNAKAQTYKGKLLIRYASGSEIPSIELFGSAYGEMWKNNPEYEALKRQYITEHIPEEAFRGGPNTPREQIENVLRVLPDIVNLMSYDIDTGGFNAKCGKYYANTLDNATRGALGNLANYLEAITSRKRQ